MLFEPRDTVPEVSPSWREVRDLFLRGHTRRAWKMACGRRRTPSLETPADYILNVEIARACSSRRVSQALVRRGLADFPDDPSLQLHRASALLGRGRHVPALDHLHAIEDTLGAAHRALWAAKLAIVYGDAGFRTSCRRWLEAAGAESGTDGPRVLYSRSFARRCLREWDEAVELARRCLEAAPGWSRVRAHLAHCLLARGRVEAAEAVLGEAARRGLEEAVVDFQSVMLSASLGRSEEARARARDFLDAWPQAGSEPWVRRTLCILLVEAGDPDAARRVAGGREEELGLPEIPDGTPGRHRLLPMPMIAQSWNQCLPTAAAMAAWPQGRTLDVDALFDRIRSGDGSSLWRMRRWARQNGFHCTPVRLEDEAIRQLLDRGVPLLGSLQGTLSSHVDVLCGYHEGFDVLYWRDPVDWVLVAGPSDAVLARYEPRDGVLAIIEEGRDDAREAAERWRSRPFEALLDLERAVAKGDVQEAEAAYARIPDGSTAVPLRDDLAVGIVLPPSTLLERVRERATDPAVDPNLRFRALIRLDGDTLDALLENGPAVDAIHDLGRTVRRYLHLRSAMSRGRWSRALRLVDRLLLTAARNAHFWVLKSDILAELGEQEASREAIERAIELEPYRMAHREKALDRSASRLTYAEYLEEYESLLEMNPDEKSLLFGRARALGDGPDGRAYEEAARETIRWFPRDPDSYRGLLGWYRVQDREDLVRELLGEASRMLPDVFGGEVENGPEGAAGHAAGPGASPPEDRELLLSLVQDRDEPGRAEALERLLEFQRTGRLSWRQRARLLACRLLIPDDPSTESPDPEALLPDRVSGPTRWFVRSVCERLTAADPDVRVALAVQAWLEDQVPGFRDHAGLWYEKVLLLEQGLRRERALAELRHLLKRHPAFSTAHYRMGVVKRDQGDHVAARREFERALEVNPGLPGAMLALRAIHEALGDSAAALDCTRRLRRKFPYDHRHLVQEILAVVELASVEAAEEILDGPAGDFPPRQLELDRVQVLLTGGRHEAADRRLAEIPLAALEDEPDLLEQRLWLELLLEQQRGGSERILQICERALELRPDWTAMKIRLAEELPSTQPYRARRLLRDVLVREPHPHAARMYLDIATEPPYPAARRAVLATPPDRRPELVLRFAEVMTDPVLLSDGSALLEWALEEFPESDDIRWSLAELYRLEGRIDEAIPVARELHRRRPEHPAAAGALGALLIERDPDEALRYLEKACRMDRSASNLFELARGHSRAGRETRAKELYWEVLEADPQFVAAWTNLYLLGAWPVKLWPYLTEMLQRRACGPLEQGALVFAVYVARRLGRKLPPEWYELAVQRWRALSSGQAVALEGERRKLKRALTAWVQTRPGDADGGAGPPEALDPSPLDRLLARFFWPRTSWIPGA